MRLTVEPQDREPVLGPAIRKDKPAPAPVPVAPGVVRNSDGTLSTNLPDPPPYWNPTPYGLPAFPTSLAAMAGEVEVVQGWSPLMATLAPVVLTFDFTAEERRALADFAAWIESELAQALVAGMPIPRLIDTGDTAD